MPNTLYTKVRQLADTIKVRIDQANIMEKSVWKKRCKEQIKAKVEGRMKIKVTEGRQLRFLVNDRFERKQQYIKEAAGHTAVKIMKMRLNVIDVRLNYKGKYKEEESLMYPICGEELVTTLLLLFLYFPLFIQLNVASYNK